MQTIGVLIGTVGLGDRGDSAAAATRRRSRSCCASPQLSWAIGNVISRRAGVVPGRATRRALAHGVVVARRAAAGPRAVVVIEGPEAIAAGIAGVRLASDRLDAVHGGALHPRRLRDLQRAARAQPLCVGRAVGAARTRRGDGLGGPAARPDPDPGEAVGGSCSSAACSSWRCTPGPDVRTRAYGAR